MTLRKNTQEKGFLERTDELVEFAKQLTKYQSEMFRDNLRLISKKLKELHLEFSDSSKYSEATTLLTNIFKIQAALLATIIQIKEVNAKELDELLHDKNKAHNFGGFIKEVDEKIEALTLMCGKLQTLRKLQHEKGMDVIPDISGMRKYVESSQLKFKELDDLVSKLKRPDLYRSNTEAGRYFEGARLQCASLVNEMKLMEKDIVEGVVESINSAPVCLERQKQIDGKNLEENNIASAEHTVNVLIQKVETLKSLARQLAETKGKQPAPGESPPRERGGFFAPSPGASTSSSSSSSASTSSSEDSPRAPRNASVVNAGAFSETLKKVEKEKLSKEEKKQQKKAEKQSEKHSKIYF